MQNLLRPLTFDNFIGQERLKETLKVILDSALKRKKQPDHILFHGPAGLGKTSLANILGSKIKGKTKYIQGPLLEKKADVLSMFASITNGDVIFIDEIHGVNKTVEELLYSAMEDGVLDVLIGPDGDQKIMRMKLPKFTLIGATTKFSKLSQPLKDRFGFIGKLLKYADDEIKQIITNSAEALKIRIDDESLKIISSHSRQTPRIANNLLKRCLDFAIAKGEKIIKKIVVYDAFDNIGLYKYGLTDHHINYLNLLANSFKNKWASIDSIIGILNDDKQNIEREIEPILIYNGLIEKGSRGRRITIKGVNYSNSYNLK